MLPKHWCAPLQSEDRLACFDICLCFWCSSALGQVGPARRRNPVSRKSVERTALKSASCDRSVPGNRTHDQSQHSTSSCRPKVRDIPVVRKRHVHARVSLELKHEPPSKTSCESKNAHSTKGNSPKPRSLTTWCDCNAASLGCEYAENSRPGSQCCQRQQQGLDHLHKHIQHTSTKE